LLTFNGLKTGPSLIALSPDGFSLAVTINKQLSFYNTITSECDETIDDVCEGSVSEISFSNDNKYLAIACDRQIKVFHNVTGHRVAIQDLKTKIIKAKTVAIKERMQQQIDENEYN
jgi:WD40 repeat protein